MELLGKPGEIKKKISQICPSKIAVAYIGEDWRKFIMPKSLKEIIVSPTLGSNPRAIADLAGDIGWDRVHFLEGLHSKIYIGGSSAIIGSANLSKPALGNKGNFETCVYFNEEKMVESLNEYFKFYLSKAREKYQTEQEKVTRLEKLLEEHNKAVKGRFKPTDNSHITNFLNYEYGSGYGKFYIIWYCDEDPGELNYEKLQNKLPGKNIEEIKNDITDVEYFHPEDNIKEGYWVLWWKKTEKNKVDGRTNLHWSYFHGICRNGVIDNDGFTKDLVFDLKSSKSLLSPPFDIKEDKLFKKAFALVIKSGDFEEFRDSPINEPWLVKNTEKRIPDLIKAIKEKHITLRKE